MTDLAQLWRISHDRTEIPAGEFLDELAELGHKITQQTLSNYVRRGWVKRKRIDVAPAGVGQSGFFERRMLIPALLAIKVGRHAANTIETLCRKPAGDNDAEYIARCLAMIQFGSAGVLAEVDAIRTRPLREADFMRLRAVTVDYLWSMRLQAYPPAAGGARAAFLESVQRNEWERERFGRIGELLVAALEDPLVSSFFDFDPAAARAAESQRLIDAHEALIDLLKLRPLDRPAQPNTSAARAAEPVEATSPQK